MWLWGGACGCSSPELIHLLAQIVQRLSPPLDIFGADVDMLADGLHPFRELILPRLGWGWGGAIEHGLQRLRALKKRLRGLQLA
jgi:hypothetical protein